ncbi:hypothetical protein cypCar_00033011, partial [Cyprinus carpio]
LSLSLSLSYNQTRSDEPHVLLVCSPAVSAFFNRSSARVLLSSCNIVTFVPRLEFHDNLMLNSKTGVQNIKIIAIHGPPLNPVRFIQGSTSLEDRICAFELKHEFSALFPRYSA